ncbi:hypothetical protein C1H76_3530 [Elsinoe australis]|uniref:Bacteriophage T5 Orf172 DNA-binding domain-containing protein n=1 Tax=Elsinoe australis TaxID=40998 RepID=A0A4U7B982_9PEZI|nr:hypothetical protein C1H76_3530 [Elsinoe australis]
MANQAFGDLKSPDADWIPFFGKGSRQFPSTTFDFNLTGRRNPDIEDIAGGLSLLSVQSDQQEQKPVIFKSKQESITLTSKDEGNTFHIVKPYVHIESVQSKRAPDTLLQASETFEVPTVPILKFSCSVQESHRSFDDTTTTKTELKLSRQFLKTGSRPLTPQKVPTPEPTPFTTPDTDPDLDPDPNTPEASPAQPPLNTRDSKHCTSCAAVPNWQSYDRTQSPNPPDPTRPSPFPLTNMIDLIPRHLCFHRTRDLWLRMFKPNKLATRGYIYCFWLDAVATPVPRHGAADEDDASDPSVYQSRDVDEVVRVFCQRIARRAERRTTRIKIGYAADVRERVAKWTGKCGLGAPFFVSWPAVDAEGIRAGGRARRGQRARSDGGRRGNGGRESSESVGEVDASAADGGGRLVPDAERVESLVHRELADKWVPMEKCVPCDRKHDEWFELEVSEESVRKLDGIVRKWIRFVEDTTDSLSFLAGPLTRPAKLK